MNTRLETYRRKRNFRVTEEPRGRTSARAAKRPLRYVIQRHEARRLHYDFRLEIDGVLVSWAVPKGPSLDPAVKRLAVHVEDHPLEYGDFEGDIPAGQYGAGHVDIWDSGSWTPSSDPSRALNDGHLKFELDGGLKGEWVLLRTGKESTQWLLRKLDDEHAQPGHDAETDGAPPDAASDASPAAPARKTDAAGDASNPGKPRKAPPMRKPPPSSLPAQLATLVDRPPRGPGWSYEVKYDGYRILCRLEGGKARLLSRNGNEWNARMKGLADELQKLGLGDGWIDGEVVCFDDQGISRFQALQQALDGASGGLVFVAFDLPFWNGVDLRAQPLSERQRRLQELLEPLPADGPIMFTQQLDVSSDTEGASAWTEACRLSLEGLICKKKDSPYTDGRSKTWLKLKCRPQQEFVVGGYTEPSGARSYLGALLVGLRDGKKLNYTGRVGTGFTQATLKDLHGRLQKLRRKTSPFSTSAEGRGRYGRSSGAIQWVTPKLVAQVDYAGWTEDGLLRQAAFRGLRDDKPASAVTGEEMLTLEQLQADSEHAGDGRKRKAKKAPSSASATKANRAGRVVIGGVSVSHPDRKVYTKPDFSKKALVEYYASVAEFMLPHLLNRRVALLRCPQGTNATCFFQKHLRSEPPEGVTLDEEQVVIENARGLLELAQFGVIEFHTWGSSLPRADRPDRITLDLDPDPDIPWADIVIAARLVQRLMQEAGLVPYLKTTGGKGLHLVAPIKASHSWDKVKEFSRAMAAYLGREAPSQFTASVSKARRKGLIFVDYLRNGNGATAIAAFSARARQGAPVSMPVAWDELDSRHDLRAARFNIANALKHRQEQGGDPWQDYAASRKALRLSFQKELQA
ncbi:DNA ligase D [Pusillimonas noertemannii]|uniref:DNA ligase D n=1 Tax=Pusillimonas noertemannii TaxID=305977 RepID=UPI00333F5F79